jgi:hypothetical protein
VGRPSHRSGTLTAVLAALLIVGAMGGPARSEPAVDDPAGLDAELLRELEAAAARDRAARQQEAEQEAAARAAREAEEAARRNAARQAERAAARPLERALADEQARQEALLDAVQGRGGADPIPPPASPDPALADPRVASPPPALRPLPREIFDRSEEVIRPGTWGQPTELRVERLVLDADGDGHPEVIRFVDRRTGELIRQEEDRNYDGVLDAWTQLTGGAVTSRTLDGNDDGNPDVFETYDAGRLVRREIDRDDDGVRDVFYRYRGESLAEERHDADNDGVIDLVVVYEARLRLRAEEDVDRDGRMDVWTRYVNDGGRERVARVERDTRGLGFADTFEIFEAREGGNALVRREEDLDGDGEIDVVSFYEGGKLRRRQIRGEAVASR